MSPRTRRTAALEGRLGYRFRDPERLRQALTHRSFAFEAPESAPVPHYERLEFLGDSLLGFVVGSWLIDDDPAADEGDLTRRKQSVVSTEALARVARRLELGGELRLGKGEESTGGREKTSILADAMESILGAIYLDGGIRPARAAIHRLFRGELVATRRSRNAPDDFKTRLQEAVQARLRQTPRYRLVATEGPAHDARFEAEVRVGATVVGTGSGRSRKQAEQAAARDALERGWAAEGGDALPEPR